MLSIIRIRRYQEVRTVVETIGQVVMIHSTRGVDILLILLISSRRFESISLIVAMTTQLITLLILIEFQAPKATSWRVHTVRTLSFKMIIPLVFKLFLDQ